MYLKMQLKIRINFKSEEYTSVHKTKEYVTRYVEINNIKILCKDVDIPSNYDALDEIKNLIETHNWRNSEEIHNELIPHIRKLQKIIDAYNDPEKDKSLAIDDVNTKIKGLKCISTVEFILKDKPEEDRYSYYDEAENLSEDSIYTAKLFIIEKPKYLYIITEKKDDYFGCCHSPPATYEAELPIILTLDEPNLVNYNGYMRKKCHIYKLNHYEEYVFDKIKGIN